MFGDKESEIYMIRLRSMVSGKIWTSLLLDAMEAGLYVVKIRVILMIPWKIYKKALKENKLISPTKEEVFLISS